MWPRRQANDANVTSGAPISRPTAPLPSSTACPPSSSRSYRSPEVLGPSKSAVKATTWPIKTHKAVASGPDDAAWLSRALDKKKIKKKAKKQKVTSSLTTNAATSTDRTVQKHRKGGALELSMSVQKRRQLWREGAMKQPQDQAAEDAKREERERLEVGFESVFQDVFTKERGEKSEDEEHVDEYAGVCVKKTALELSLMQSIEAKDGESIKEARVTQHRALDDKDEQEKQKKWAFASDGNSSLNLDDFEYDSGTTTSDLSGFRAAAEVAEFTRWKAEDTQRNISDNFVRLNMRKRFKGSSGRPKKRPAYLRSRSENFLDKATGDSGDPPTSLSQRQAEPLFVDDGVDFVEECLKALAKAEQEERQEEPEAVEPPKCHHALPCQSLEVKKRNKNCGRRFFACPFGFDEGRCDFFLWQDDYVPVAMQTLFTVTSSSKTDASEAASTECVPLNLLAPEEKLRDAMRTNLRLVFGHAEFRPGQEWAILRVFRQQDTLLVLPTGAGKSLCYQFPALFLSGLTLVISPLISLMNDQYESLPPSLKARAVCLSGSDVATSKATYAAFVRDLVAEKLSLVYLSPEKALSAGIQALLALPRVRTRLALVCVDEAHCVSEWSHHFRPSYLRLAQVFRYAQCVLCVTATASRRVVRDVLHQLHSRQRVRVTTDQECEKESEMVLQLPWQRHNIALEVRSVRTNEERLEHLFRILPQLSNELGSTRANGGMIVYVHQQRQAEEIAALLREHLPSPWRNAGKVAAFHAGMPSETKEKVRTGFARGRVKLVVATVAFGMGIDKKNVRAVVHFHLPSSVEAYVQQIGRAGRDGKAARAVLYLLNDDAVHFRSLLFSTALHRDQLQQLLALVYDAPSLSQSSGNKIVRLNYADHRANETLTLVSLERDWLEQHLDVKAATIETFLTLLALETQSQANEQQSKCGVRVTLEPVSMSRCTLQLLDAQTKTFAPHSAVKLLFEAVQRNELRTAQLTQHTNGYLSSWEVEFHLQEAAQWYASTRGRSASNEAAASSVRRLLQELRGAQQRGELQRLTLARPAFYVHVRCPHDERDRMDAHDVARWTHVLYAKHAHLESHQVARLGQLYGALSAAALPVPSSGGAEQETEHEANARAAKARVLETKIVQYFDDHERMGNGQWLETLLRPLTPSLVDAIERDVAALVESFRENGNKAMTWTSVAVAKVFHGLSSPRFPARAWRDHVAWRRYADVAFERLVQIAAKVVGEPTEARERKKRWKPGSSDLVTVG
ncbi:hypothetical protein PsorP6_012364 [Peronosclerospora sorghi]|uniref:Uncharacterized protein n=1 Tax=Peronosclerospora sorghi TaxID=230839 RepID=A0ACC0WGC5_9STRA|nr:hypothetical protein PsorP6_012364 [Peronosclerospora sorghi]